MESLNALIQGMGLMHLQAGQAAMLLVSLLLLWLAIAKKFEPLLLLPIGFGGLLSNIPEAGLALSALENLLAHHDPLQLAVIAAKLMNVFSKHKINPLIGSAGVSAVPMAARVSNKVGLEADGQNFLLMHAMGPNVAGVIGSAIAAGVMLKYVLAM
ncbi:sodium ion-translocating decarboxylase subunit beta [Klebsiella aerogenes]|uniref:sodium ion-translocating decarboxylase subunit beta n=1 Tax=Klebsiella aerogenes TaxID=548 RepID=UPI00218443E6|nr:sodium ion-translocating decarboxylase subunit beta [Klebsiella aerogenes]MCT2788295.1 sodium ion-translocating decarboxylase subunit beta [Klebsiella aerogenes]MCT2808494.1 sodium ion-translocating decarboxylase subunit beta [Klebsiella aerogenes]MCT2813568.1 sodium ion-translocating decarboxylase subunit beta [Klebsiella aerogenes]MCT2849978.1 sodium ion-translocating decarboxylase subunit beta [Klebsiella aerogenes]